jgi:hypothetical protein
MAEHRNRVFKGDRAMETLTMRPKRDRRTQHRVPPVEIARRAYELYEQRGGEHGHDMDDWLRAEHELRHQLDSAAA